jgi:hypothetical protein
MTAPIRLAAALTVTALLVGCGSTPAAVHTPMARAGQVAAANWDRMEISYTYKLGSKAAKAFLAEAEAAAESYRKAKTTCTLTAKGGLFGTTIQVELAGTMENVMNLREDLDALHKKHK